MHGSHHSLDIEHLTAERHVSILERVAPLLDVLLDLLGKLLGSGMRKNSLSAVTITERVDGHVLESHHIQINLLVVLVRSIVVGGKLAELLDLFLR